MVGFPTVQAYLDAVDTPGPRYRWFSKTTGTQTTQILWTYWRAAGRPVPGGVPTVGLGGAVKLDRNTPGAIEFAEAPAGQNNYIMRVQANKAVSGLNTQVGTYILCDRLAHANLDVGGGAESGAFSPTIDGTDRLAAGEGAMILLEITTALSGPSNVISFEYTNQAGTTGKITPDATLVNAGVVDRSALVDFIWMPLADGDSGVRVITALNGLTLGAQGNVTVSLVRPLAWLPQHTALFPAEREFGLQKQYMDVLPSTACLFWLLMPNTISTNATGLVTVISA